MIETLKNRMALNGAFAKKDRTNNAAACRYADENAGRYKDWATARRAYDRLEGRS